MTKMSNSCYKMNEENPLKLKKDSLYLHLHKLSIKLSFFSERFVGEPYKSVSAEGPGSDLAPTVTDHSGLPTGPSGSACPVGVNHWTPTAVEGAFVVLLAPLPRSLSLSFLSISIAKGHDGSREVSEEVSKVRGMVCGVNDPSENWHHLRMWSFSPKRQQNIIWVEGKTKRQEKYQSCTDRVNPWTKISKRLIVTT